MVSRGLSKNESGMTLVELLLVMGIIAILLGLGVSGYVGMRNVQSLEQVARSLYANLRDEQRDALLYNRNLGENWVWGKIVSFEMMNDAGAGVSGESKIIIYKYCAPDYITEFEQYPEAGTPLPVGTMNPSKTCVTANPSLARTEERPVGDKLSFFSSELANGQEVTYVVFEALSGKVHFYDAAGADLGSTQSAEIVMGNPAPSNKLIRFDSDYSRFSLETVDGSYKE